MEDELIIGFSPKTKTEEACLLVIRRNSPRLYFADGVGTVQVVKSFYGDEAIKLYSKLIGVESDG